jgi:hypothetical protein
VISTALHVCALCGAPVELSRIDSIRLFEWEQRLGLPLVVHCISCARPLMEEA